MTKVSEGDKITEDDVNMIDYFIMEKDDITRWCDWEKRKPIIAKHCPELIDALERKMIAERTVHAIVRSLADRYL